jgi:hypothetical protein
MADNYSIVQTMTLGTAAADDIGGTLHPYRKIEFGADGTAVPVGTANPLPVTLQTKIAGEDLTNDLTKVEQRFSPYYLAAAGTTTVKSSSGFIHTLSVTGGGAGVIVGYDSASGTSATKLFDFDSTNTPNTYIFDCTFNNGLTLVLGTTTKVALSYR